MKTWACWVPEYDGDPIHRCGLYRAESRSKARYLAYLRISDPFPDTRITQVRVRRAAEYDRHVFREGVMPKYATPPTP